MADNNIVHKAQRILRRSSLLGSVVTLGFLAAACNSGAPPTESGPGADNRSGTREAVARSQHALAGVDGAATITAAGTVVNRYTVLAGNAAVGATTVVVGAVADLAVGADALAPGDLLLVMQMQGATLNTTATDQTWGSVTSLGGAGLYEFVEVLGVNAATNTITLSCALKNAYSVAGHAQVVRVPQYDSLTVASGGSIIAPAWNGTVGGIVAVHARTTIALAGDISVTGLGFRGGAVDNTSADAANDTPIYVSANAADGARKGEGIGGLLTQYGRAPAANGGGGGNAHNGGGGGGSNARSGAAWTGQGVFDLTVKGGVTAWPQDPNYTTTAPEGGGRGGYTFSQNDQNALALGPNQAQWAGNNRRERGGMGGHALDNQPATRIYMGGGGGAGDGNNNHSGRGGNGGGIVFLLAGTVSGGGRILANGEAGVDANSLTGAANGDAPGGGGGGGSVIVRATTANGFSVQATGGLGGTQQINNGDEAEGPGGGGGGGFVSISATVTADVSGGASGTTTSPALAEFPANGATRGGNGQAELGAAASGVVPICVDTTIPDTFIDTKPASATNDTTGDFVFRSNDTAATFECRVDGAAYANCAATFATAALAQGSHTLDVRAKDTVGNVDATPATYTWTVDTTAPDTAIGQKPAASTNDTTGDFTFTSNETGVTFECQVDTGAFAACTTPYATAVLLDGAHTLSVRARDAAGNVDASPATYTWTVDATAPDTTIGTKPAAVTADVTGDFTFTSNDSNATFECQLDSGAYAACTTPYATLALADGSHTLSVRARDALGNLDTTPATYTWTVDATAPETTIATKPEAVTASVIGNFTFTSNDGGATFECQLDGGAYAACTSPLSTAALADGSHTLSVRAKDTLGNVDATPATYTWIVDATPPDTEIATKPAATTTDPTGDFTFTSNEGGVTFECQLDGGVYAACTTPLSTAALTDGSHTLSVRAKDAVGNLDASPATYTWTIDGTVPETTIVNKPPALSAEATGTFTFTSNESGATFECQLDTGAFAACTTPHATGNLADGSHTFSVRAKDDLGNTDASPAVYSWVVDTTPPETVLATKPANPSSQGTATFTFSASETDASFECSLDDMAFAACSSPDATASLLPGSHSYSVRAKDAAGNVDATPAIYQWVVTADFDGDGLSDDQEAESGTDPKDADSDDDGILDGAEPSPGVDSDGDGLVNALDPDSDNDGIFDGTESGVTTPPAGTDVTRGRFVSDADPLTTTDPLVADTDQGGLEDGIEDVNHNGKIDSGERDPNDATDDAEAPADRDGDGLSDDQEREIGTDPSDADSDDDGVLDGDEPNFTDDGDGDGLINPLDPDSDDDGLLDGTELGLDCDNPATNTLRRLCVPDGDKGDTTTSPVDPDTDHGGVTDGNEDSNLNGVKDEGETDPTLSHGADDGQMKDTDGDGLSDGTETTIGSNPKDADSDDDGVPDGDEPNPSVDGDGDGLINVLDVDSDNDGLFDGTEMGLDCENPATDARLEHCIADQDPSSLTSPVDADTDHGGVRDGSEDSNLNGKLDQGETNPVRGEGVDDEGIEDSDGDGLSDATEGTFGSDPMDIDSDDDGVFDGDEPNPGDDQDGDGVINVLDPDSDGDGLFDGTENGRDCSNPATDADKNQCIPDGDSGRTTTWVLVGDTDHGGVLDGVEDTNHDGVRQPLERDPLDGSDDEQVPGEGGAGGSGGEGTGALGGGGTGAVGGGEEPPGGAAGGGGAPTNAGGSENGGSGEGGESTGGSSPSTGGIAGTGGTIATGGSSSTATGGNAGTTSDNPQKVVVLGGGLCTYRPAPHGFAGELLVLSALALSAACRRRRR